MKKEGINMRQIIKYALLVVFIVGLVILAGRSGLLEASKGKSPAQFEMIDFEFKVYTLRGHEYLTKENFGLVHMADCKRCGGTL
jgi:hypothetical protein